MADAHFKKFKSILRQNNYFVTKARMSLFGHLQNSSALSTVDLLNKVEKHHKTSVYRNIAVFEELGIITKVRLGWTTKIELSDIFKHHHHHFTCLGCGSIFDLPEVPEIESNITQLTRQIDAKATDHSLEIRGYCKKCNI